MFQQTLQQLKDSLKDCQGSQRFHLNRSIQRILKQSEKPNAGLNKDDAFNKDLKRLENKITQSIAKRAQRLANLPTPEYPDLPVAERREEIIKTIQENQVTIICGETGSGKTTQLPKMCLEMGRGVDGLIGHTQPRRIAARSVAARIAEELKSELGSIVGYKVRFHDHTKDESYVKLMTDGILLAEIRNDRYLNQYDTLIVDEAHERSLNIDFLIGYLRWLLPRRKDLKVIITSATIDPQRFARHFNFTGKEDGDAPIIEVSGRTYPVEVRYHSLLIENGLSNEKVGAQSTNTGERKAEPKEKDMVQAIVDATDELMAEAPGGILIFLSGEREIREASEALRKHHKPSVEILPLFARLSNAEQNRIFHVSNKGSSARRIVLSTNVAETSLTVPGIKYVIDTGMARISRYSWRSRVQRLPIEKISQASANQRSGRCGRTSDGIAIRLYAEDDYLGRAEFTLPEIQRTNLASVILQLASLNLGDVYKFPYVEAPDAGMIRDGYKLLFELSAVNKISGDNIKITPVGRQLASLPTDPRLGRMLLAAKDLGVMEEVLVIVSALSIQDVRERPMDKQQASDQKHSRFKDDKSDFISLLKIWDYYHDKNGELSQGQLRKLCKREFLSFMRLREWNETYRQLRMSLKDSGALDRTNISKKKKVKPSNKKPSQKIDDDDKYAQKYDVIHQSLLTGLLSNIGFQEENQEYLGANGRKFFIFPASGLRKRSPKWLMSADIVETSRLFARTVATIQPQWIEYAAKHLLKYHYSEPRWEKRSSQVAADERTTIYGITVNPKKRVNFGAIDAVVSRQLFIRHALVYGEYQCKADFFIHNRQLVEEVEALEAKARRRDILVDEEILYDFYDKLIPDNIYSGPAFEKWRKKFEHKNPQGLLLTRDYLMQRDDSHVQGEQYPDHMNVLDMMLPLNYHFEPNSENDGVTIRIPAAAMNQLSNANFDYLVPGMLEEKVTEFIKSLPKQVRKQFVPAPEYAKACLEAIDNDDAQPESIVQAIVEALRRMTGFRIDPELLQAHRFSDHMLMRYEIVDEAGKTLKTGRDLEQLKESVSYTASENLDKVTNSDSIERSDIQTWDFEPLPETTLVEVSGMKIKAWPALVDKGDSVAIKLFDSAQKAQQQNGLLRLVLLKYKEETKALLKQIPDIHKMCLNYNSTGKCEELKKSIVKNAFRLNFISGDLLKNKHGCGIDEAQFLAHCDSQKNHLSETLKELCQQLLTLLSLNHQIKKQLKGTIDLSLLETLNDIRDQVESLVYMGFLNDLSLDELRQYPRYLKAIVKRLHKLAGDAHKDRGLFLQVQPFWDDYKKLQKQKGDTQELRALRWMLEEFRVSLFAQDLGTAYPVSAKRIVKMFKEVESIT